MTTNGFFGTDGVRGRVLLRPSGTEKLLRIMVEGESLDDVNHIADELYGIAQKISAELR